MASGTPCSNSTRVRQKPLQIINISRLSWPKPSSSGDKPGSGAAGIEKGIAEDTFVVEERSAEELKQESSTPLTRVDVYAKTSYFPEDESCRMVHSPARSWNGSASNEKTPRFVPSDAARPSPSPRLLPKDMSRQDSAYESVRGLHDEINPDIQTRNIRARERVEILRGRVLRTRGDINEKREEVQALREKFRNATDKLMRALDEFMVQERDRDRDRAALSQYYEQVRSLQDQLGPAEDEYDTLEFRLNREEKELEQEETRFYTANNIILRLHPDDELDEHLTPLIKPYEPEDIEYDDLDLNNELVKQYLAAVEEANHLGEQLDSLEDEQYQLSQELSFRTRHKLHISERIKTFLFEFPDTHKALLEQLHNVEDSLYDLRDRCVAEQLFTAAEYPYVPHNALVEEINESVNDARDRSPLRTAVLHHNVAAHLQEPNFDDKKDYVNSWMLDWIQDSTLDKLRLKQIIYSKYPPGGKQLQDDEWSELALDFWDQDDAGKFANQKRVLSTMDALRGGTGSSVDDVSLLVEGEEVFDTYIMGSEAASFTTQKGGFGTRLEEVSSDLELVIRMGPPPARRSSF
ncbi:hypothetical protein NA56DRAFT_645884 [Hyaloscypha hepaticicola]|uniref:Uncharacterized protein n=1 Tax=Hyaloscypha hepaticicola TaxID=2082293 RepID=A0A2J6Q4L2_9HELO|nr:hypothetical protein NA56DRAFT_645884 [Hyaloscypha hepaticicola]